jgi:PKD repeat protein
MKRILIIVTTVGFLVSCHVDPHADFYADNDLVEPYEPVNFTNVSDNSDYFDWDFGDGYYTNVVHPSHSYDYEGIYTVSLTAFNHNYSDRAYMDIEVYETTLEVSVYEWNSGYYYDHPIRNAEVSLYRTLSDWEQLTNRVVIGTTDADGIVIFKGLEPRSYYINAENLDYSNYQLGHEDVNFILTAPLAKAQYNDFTAWVDYDPVPKAERRSKKNTKINSTPRTFKKIELSK